MVGLPFSLSRAVVVSLADSDRRPGFFAQPLGEIFEVFDAFHGATQDWTPYFDAERFAGNYLRPPAPAEIGCAISHARVIRAFAAETGDDADLLLVAEDDARFTADLPCALRAVTEGPLPHDVVVLTDGLSLDPALHRRRFLTSISQLSLLSRTVSGPERRHRIGRFAGQGDCSGLYLMTRGGARKFDDYVRALPEGKLQRVANVWPDLRDEGGVDVALVRPSLVRWSGGSTIRASEDGPAARREAPLPPSLRDRIAVRSRLRGAGPALRATVEDAGYRIRGVFRS
ncbi:glycosyltransferase family 25 protein [Kocuria sp. BT304]|uniref:glycosyltransferase family 25 protein n=1 Tax=Kocuria sp. BT304 TaxID=1702043 RepID=UPI000DD43488|nr:glycosyltransferase family 25 protein [Kocuria sp. BT304]